MTAETLTSRVVDGTPLVGVGGFWILDVLSINELHYLHPPTLQFLGMSADDDFIIT